MDQVRGLSVSAGVGALVGMIIGIHEYMGGRGALPTEWISRYPNNAFLWALAGAAIGCGLFYLLAMRR